MKAFCSVITTGRSIKIGCLSIKSLTRLGVSSFSGIAIFRKSSSFFLTSLSAGSSSNSINRAISSFSGGFFRYSTKQNSFCAFWSSSRTALDFEHDGL